MCREVSSWGPPDGRFQAQAVVSCRSQARSDAAADRVSLVICENPFVSVTGQAYGCGQCLPCRLNRRRIWTHRIMLEAAQHGDNAFVTLTYSDEFLPVGATLVKKDVQDWLKRFRKKIEPLRIRYFVVGEYGELSNRPHYHAAIFGFPGCGYGSVGPYYGRGCECASCGIVRSTWGRGNVQVGTLGIESAQYVCGYVTKKMTSKDDSRLNGRAPEFAEMSRRPGVGRDAMDEVAKVLRDLNLADGLSDVPTSLRHGTRLLPLGRYLRRHLRKLIGRDEKISQAAMDELTRQMFDLRLAARNDAANPSLKAHILAANKGRVASVVGRSKLRKKREML